MSIVRSLLIGYLLIMNITSIVCTSVSEKPIVIVTPSYNNKQWWQWNLESLINQEYSNYYIIITDDCSTDGTGDAIEAYIQLHNLSHKVILIKNKERRGALYNLYTMIHSCPDHAIIVTVDGDDALPDPQTLARINYIYSTQDVWLTYGQFQEYPSGGKGWCTPMPENIIKNNAFREFVHIPSHLRTFYAGLFKKIKLEDMIYYGEFYAMTWDYVMMLPMIEMAGSHHYYFGDTIMYLYNNSNTISDHRISRQLQQHLGQIVRKKSRYTPLEQPFTTTDSAESNVGVIIFSEKKDPVFLDSLLADFENKVIGYEHIHVLYYPAQHQSLDYQMVKDKYPHVQFYEITEYRENFRALLKSIYQKISSNYFMLCQSNIKIEKNIDLNICVKALEKTYAHTFCFALSKNNCQKPLPPRLPVFEIQDGICAWDFSIAQESWSCANNVSMNVYRKNDFFEHVLEEGYMEPSSGGLQALWANEGNLNKVGLCFKDAHVIFL